MEVQITEIPEVKVISPKRHRDDRGFLSEVYSKPTLADLGISDDFVQENHTHSAKAGTVRGLHYQVPPHPAAKLVRVVRGAAFDVAVDLRRGSPTYGDHVSVILSADNWNQLYIPRGFAHGFCTLDPDTDVTYRASALWQSELDRGILWADPRLAISWPVDLERAVLSSRDRELPSFAELSTPFSYGDDKLVRVTGR